MWLTSSSPDFSMEPSLKAMATVVYVGGTEGLWMRDDARVTC